MPPPDSVASWKHQNWDYEIKTGIHLPRLRLAVMPWTLCLLHIFIACQHTDARYWYSNSQILSVCPSVRHAPVFFEKGLTHCYSFFTIRYPIILALWVWKHLREIPTGSPLTGTLNRGGDFQPPITHYISQMIQDSAIVTPRIGNRTQAFEWHQFQWPSVTSKPHFKVTILFNVK